MDKLWYLEINIFAMVAVGYLVRRTRLLTKKAELDLTNLVLCVILPCNIFNSFIGVAGDGQYADFLWILGISCGIQLIALAYNRLAFRGYPQNERANLSYAMICSNAGFLGNPIAEGVFGPAGMVLGGIYLIPQRIMMWSEGLALYTGIYDKRVAARKVLTHPCVIACELGILFMAAGVKLPRVILEPIQMFAKCNTALSMLVIGMTLAEIDLHHLVDHAMVMFTLHRLVLLPLVVYGLCLLLPISGIIRGVSVLLAAMPAGATTTMLAAKYECDPQFATRLVIFSTLCSLPATVIWSIILTL